MVIDKRLLAPYKGGKNSFGFINGHIYEAVIEEKKRGFELSTYYDTTIKHEFVKERIPYSNEASLKKSWDI